MEMPLPHDGHADTLPGDVESGANDGVKKWELKQKNLPKGLGQEAEMDEVDYIIKKLCDHPVLSRLQERTIAEEHLETRNAFLACLSTFTVKGKEEEALPAVAALGCYEKLKALFQQSPVDNLKVESVLGEPFSVAAERFVELQLLHKNYKHVRETFVQYN